MSPKNCIVHAAFHSFTTVVEQWSVAHRADPEHGKTSRRLTYNLNYWAAGGQKLNLLLILQKVQGQVHSDTPVETWSEVFIWSNRNILNYIRTF